MKSCLYVEQMDTLKQLTLNWYDGIVKSFKIRRFALLQGRASPPDPLGGSINTFSFKV